jgi:hypothetical protein
MGMDLVYVRFPERLLDLGLRDRTAGQRLAQGAAPLPLAPGETMEDIVLGRSERSLYRILGKQDGRDYWDGSDPEDWVKRALIGARPFPHGCDPHIYGPSRYLTPADVGAVADGLDPLEESGFRERYGRYIARHGRLRPDLGDDGLETYLLPNFDKLRQFYLKARRYGQAVVITPG